MCDEPENLDAERALDELLAQLRQETHLQGMLVSDLLGIELPIPNDIRLFEDPPAV